MEKKSQIVVGGEVVDAAAITVSAFGKDLVPLSADVPNGPAVMAEFSPESAEEITTVDNPRRRSSVPPAPISPEHAQALRQINHEPEPIPEGALYHVRAYSETGEPASDALLDQTLGGGTATNLATPMTHAEAVAVCLGVNGKLQEAEAPIWLGVFGVDEQEAEGPASESTGTGRP